MGKRGDLAFIISFLLILAPMVFAWDSQASININSIYETNTADFVLNINNPQANNESINTISAETSGFAINSATDSSGWRDLVQAATITWDIFIPFGTLFDWVANLPYINLGVSSDANQNFRFNARAQKVDSDTTYNWPVVSTFHDSTNDVEVLTITVLNDDTGPVLSDWTPQDGDFVMEGTDNLPANINATDPETGVLQVFFNYIDCAELGNSSAKTSINLTKDEEVYSGTADVSQYEDSTEVCFSFIAENNGGAFSNESGRFTIDGIAPVVSLITPDDGAIMNALSEFEFLAQDNLAPTMGCDLYSDGVVYASVTADNGVNEQVNASNMPEGKHNWSVACTDLAGWTGYSEERTYILDRTPPNITLNSPENGAIVKAGTIVDISITDNVQLAGVEYAIDTGAPVSANESIIIDTSTWLDGTYVITVNATDAAGNIATENFVIIIDKLPPAVDLISPGDGAVVDYHVDFTFNVSDNHDTMIDCDIIVDSEVLAETVVNTTQSETAVVPVIVDLGAHEWHVMCIDDAENKGTSSQSWNFTAVDTTGPDITVNDIGTIVRGNTAVLNITLWDISGIEDSSIVVEVTDPNGIVVPVTVTEQDGYYTGNFITTVASALGQYDISAYAEDTAGNSNTGAGSFEVTYGYVVNIDLNPSSVLTNEEVTATGSVRFDNDSLVPDEFVTLILPDTTLQVALDPSTGGFTHIFTVSSAGSYDITATITPENGFTFSDAETLIVNAPSDGDDEGEGGGDDDEHRGGPPPVYSECGDGTRDAGENCETCPEDAGCRDNQYCDAGVCKTVVEEDNCNGANLKKDPNNCGECGVQCPLGWPCEKGICIEPPECKHDSDCGKGQQCNEGKCVGQQDNKSLAAKATGFLSLKAITSNLFWWVVLMLLAIMFVLTYMRKRGLPGFKKEDEFGLDEYLNRKH